MDYRTRVMSGETLNVTLPNGNKGEVLYDSFQDSIVFRAREGWIIEHCGAGSVEPICAPDSDYFNNTYMVGAIVADESVSQQAA